MHIVYKENSSYSFFLYSLYIPVIVTQMMLYIIDTSAHMLLPTCSYSTILGTYIAVPSYIHAASTTDIDLWCVNVYTATCMHAQL